MRAARYCTCGVVTYSTTRGWNGFLHLPTCALVDSMAERSKKDVRELAPIKDKHAGTTLEMTYDKAEPGGFLIKDKEELDDSPPPADHEEVFVCQDCGMTTSERGYSLSEPKEDTTEPTISVELLDKIETIAGYLEPLYEDLDILKKMGTWHFMPGLIEEVNEWLEELRKLK